MEELQIIDRTSLARFLSRWHGDDAAGETEGANSHLPSPLREWYTLTSGRDVPAYAYYRFVASAAVRSTGGVTAFCASPHDSFVWGFGGDAEDPDTFEDADECGWSATGFVLSELLLHIAVSGAVLAAECRLQNTSSTVRNAEALAARMDPLRPGIWSWPDPLMRYYCRDDVIAQIRLSGVDGDCQVLIAAPTEDDLEGFDDLEWD